MNSCLSQLRWLLDFWDENVDHHPSCLSPWLQQRSREVTTTVQCLCPVMVTVVWSQASTLLHQCPCHDPRGLINFYCICFNVFWWVCLVCWVSVSCPESWFSLKAGSSHFLWALLSLICVLDMFLKMCHCWWFWGVGRGEEGSFVYVLCQGFPQAPGRYSIILERREIKPTQKHSLLHILFISL